MKITILQIATLTLKSNEKLNELFNVVSLEQLDYFKEEIKGLVTTGGVKVNAQLLNKLPNLEVIATRGVGFDHIDLETTSKRGIVVANTPDVLTDCVADLAMSCLLAISRDIVQADKFVREGKWLNQRYTFSTKVTGKKLGIVGFGRIGQAVFKRAKAFDMQIKYFSRNPKKEYEEHFEKSLLNLSSWCDYLVVCAPGGKDTQHLISKEVLENLGENGFLINIARGSLVDENALIEALEQNKIAGAALDVFANGPQVPSELLNSSKVILTPHIASSTNETFDAMEALLLENLEQYFTTGKVVAQVEKVN